MRKLSISLGLLGVLALALLPAAFAEGLRNPASAPSNVLTYPGGAPCNTTLQACLSAANNGDIVSVLAGTYITDQLNITRAIVLQGAGASSTILQALGAQRVISVGANIAAGVTISNLRVFSGSLTSGGELGAGIFGSSGTPLTLLNMEVLSNTNSTNSGGGIFAGDALTMTDVDVIGNSDAGGSGGGLRANNASKGIIITGGSFKRNTSSNPGGAMRVNGPLTLASVTIISNSITNSTQDGGGIRADGGLFMLAGLVQNNVSARDGGGIFASSAVISAAQIISNAADNGGGILVSGALAITNTLLDKNIARTGNGGSIFSAGSGITITLEGTGGGNLTTVSNSTAVTNGGGIFAAGSVLLVGAVSFNSNKALNGEGGAIYTNDLIDSSGTSVLLAVTFTGNTALGKGGAVRALGKVNLLNLPAFLNNSAGGGTTADGGAIYADGSVFLSRGTSTGNTARNGGVVYAGGNIFFNVHNTGPNTAVLNGGCAYSLQNITYNSANATDCVAGQSGGAAYATLTVTLSANGVGRFSLNRASDGGVAFGGNAVAINQATVISNTANVGGAAVSTGLLTVNDSTLISNTARSEGGALMVLGNAFISNTVFASNRVTDTSGLGGAVWAQGTLAITNSTFLSNSVGLSIGSQGGAVAAVGRLSLLGDSFQGNQAPTGGAVRGLADVFATNTSFTGNGGLNQRLGGGIAGLTVTVSSVTMTQNTVCCTNASGGAISATVANINNSVFIQNSAFISGGAVLATQVFITGSQFLSNTGPAEGAGVWTRGGGLITNTQFSGNSTGCCSNHAGGAVFSLGPLKVYGSQFTGNDSDHGGALLLNGSQSEIHDSTFTSNFVSCCAGGGAIDAAAFFPAIYNSTFSGNHVDCCNGGGAIRASSLLYVEASTFGNNSASSDGGAILRLVGSNQNTVITASTFISNYSGTGGGAVFGNQADIENSTFISNHVASFGTGGAVALFGNNFMSGNSFTDNRVDVPAGPCSSGLGGAIYQDQSGSVTLQSSGFTRNSAPRGGALFAGGGSSIETSSFSDNSAVCLDSVTLSNIGSGGAVDARGFLSVVRSTFLHNSAGSVGGGALAFLPLSANTLHVENSLFARNAATNTVFGAHGAAIVISQSVTTGQLFFNTFADQPRNPVAAIAIYSGTISTVDNIISGHATGITRFGGTAFEDFNLYFDNGANTSGGVSSGGSSLPNSNPLFVAPGNDDYHLGAGSPAIDKGSDLGITVDHDGDPRPIGAGFDIGFDERNGAAFKLYLPLILRLGRSSGQRSALSMAMK